MLKPKRNEPMPTTGQCEPHNPHSSNEGVNNLTPDNLTTQNWAGSDDAIPASGDATSGEDFSPDWSVIDTGVFLPPEFIQFAKELRRMHDFFDEYCNVRGLHYHDHYRKIICKITSAISDIADDIGILAGREYTSTFVLGEPYCISRHEYDIEQSKELN